MAKAEGAMTIYSPHSHRPDYLTLPLPDLLSTNVMYQLRAYSMNMLTGSLLQ